MEEVITRMIYIVLHSIPDLLEFWNFYWVAINTIQPWIFSGFFNSLQSPPNRAITLESRSECYLPYYVPFLDSLLGFNICKLIPQCTAGCIAKPVKSHPRRLHVVLT